jgi:hypothetical protein
MPASTPQNASQIKDVHDRTSSWGQVAHSEPWYKARKLARKTRFFKLAHLTPRRELAPFLKTEAVEHLGANAKPFGAKFDAQVRALAKQGLTVRGIARALKVAHSTVLERTTRRRKGKPGAAG